MGVAGGKRSTLRTTCKTFREVQIVVVTKPPYSSRQLKIKICATDPQEENASKSQTIEGCRAANAQHMEM